MSIRQLKITKSITTRESASLEKYLQEIGKLPLLTPEEEVSLTRRIREGDQQALDALVASNLRFVVSVAKQYQNQGFTLSDLINEGNFGLIRAAQRFDETRGFKFISYAVWWIRQAIMQALAEQSRLVRLPLNKVGLTSKVTQVASQLEQEFEREPTSDELADRLNMGLNEVVTSLQSTQRHFSIDAPFEDSEEGTLLDVMEDPNSEMANFNLDHTESLNIELKRGLSSLTERQKEVLCYFYGIGIDYPLSLEDIGNHFHLTRERVRQIKDKAISRLQNTTRANLLRAFLGS